MSEIRDINLAPSGEKKIHWAARYMPLLKSIERDFIKEQPFKGLKMAASLHLEAKSAYLCRVLMAGGAELRITGCNPLSTQDDVVAALVKEGAEVYSWYNCTAEEYDRHLGKALEFGPNIIIDDGGDLVSMIHRDMPELIPNVIGGCEETTTGIIRLRAMEREGALKFPMMTVNDARCKHFFDNRYGTGQSVWDGINRATNLVVAGKNVVVAGYGWCGRGIAMRAKGLGARVTITEIDPVKALEAMMDGFSVKTMDDAASEGDIFVTSTGCCKVITERHFEKMRDGAILANGGHFNVEVDVDWLENNAVSTSEGRSPVTRGYTLKNGATIFVLAEGRLVNLASGDGHPVEIMDMSFAIQALAAKYLAENRGTLPCSVIDIPDEIDYDVAGRKLAACGMTIDTLTEEQKSYLASWAL
ncbi:MAG: adenosylhomocysteinase [Oscillospiraceae bacterium]